MLSHILTVAKTNGTLLEKGLADVPDDQMTRQFDNLPNHPLWQVGHLATVRGFIIGALGSKPATPESWAALFGPRTTPVADPARYPSRREVLDAYHQNQATLVQILSSLPPEKLAETNPIERIRGRAPTTGDLFVLMLLMHDGFHLGQLGAWRSANKLPGII